MRIMNRLREAKVKKFSKKKLETKANSELRGWPCPTRQQGQRQLCTFVCRHVHSINFEQICICYSYDNNTLARTHTHAHTQRDTAVAEFRRERIEFQLQPKSGNKVEHTTSISCFCLLLNIRLSSICNGFLPHTLAVNHTQIATAGCRFPAPAMSDKQLRSIFNLGA